jgi:MoaA/NifB/PqqE/SkfB family radical SAM enzyme
VQNIRLLRRSKISVLRFGTVISRDLIADFDKYLALACELKAEIWELYRPMNTAISFREAPPIAPKDLRRLAKLIEPRMGLKPGIVFANPVPICLFKKNQAPMFLGARFDDGHTRLVLDPRGFYKPSYYIQKNLGSEPLKAWNSRFLKDISGLSWLGGKCRRCTLRLRCLGGSRFAAGEKCGNYQGNDPWLSGKKDQGSVSTVLR